MAPMTDLKQFRHWPNPYEPTFTDRRARAIVAAKDGGMTFLAIADELNLGPERVSKIYKKAKAEMMGVCPCCGRPL